MKTKNLFLTILSIAIGALSPVSFGGINPIDTINYTAASLARLVSSPFTYDFRVAGTLEEAGNMDTSSSPYFWVNSGAAMQLVNGIGQTIQGSLPLGSKWQKIYASSNSLDTDKGTHPQNIFRLVTRSKWQNFSQQAYFKITADNFGSSPNRDGHNGILFFNRYRSDGQTLYYVGVRVDGKAVIKKKLNGIYTTLATKKVYPGTYSRSANVNLLPHNTWIGLKSTIQTNPDGSVSISLYQDANKTGSWTLLLQAKDSGSSSPAILDSNYAGIRTDFMDVQFDDYKLMNI